MSAVDAIRLNFDPASLAALNAILGLMMFGVALDLRVSDFRTILDLPRSALVGLCGQFALLPAFTYALTRVLDPAPSIALGMLLVAACPGGNLSNILTHLARGNTALSVSMSAISTALAAVMTPLNLAVWGSLHPAARPLLREVALSPVDLAGAILLLLGLPLAAGLFVSHRFPAVAARARRPMKRLSILVFGGFIVLALAANWRSFLDYVGLVALAVLLQNALALGVGYLGARTAGLPERDRRAVALEVGIQNSGLGLILIFDFFDGLGGMALIAAWWGIWHIVSGLTLALWWSRREPARATPPAVAAAAE